MIEWSNPTVQGALVAGAIGFVGIVLAGVAGVAGAIWGASIAAKAAKQAADVARTDAENDRIREWNVRRVEETRSQLTAITDGFLAIIDNDRAKATEFLGRVRQPLVANARLVGDIDALAMVARAVVNTQRVLDGNPVSRTIRLAIKNPFDENDRNAFEDARAAILDALDQQQERALRDQPLIALTRDQILSIPELADANYLVDQTVGTGRARVAASED